MHPAQLSTVPDALFNSLLSSFQFVLGTYPPNTNLLYGFFLFSLIITSNALEADVNTRHNALVAADAILSYSIMCSAGNMSFLSC